MTFQQELASWMTPPPIEVSSVPTTNSQAPSTAKLPFPRENGRASIITFLRHCGCPFAEKTFKDLRDLAAKNPDIDFIAVSHSDQEATDKWLTSVGGKGKVEVIVDSERQVYAQWGLGTSSLWHVLNPWSLYDVYRLGKQHGIWNRPTESGSRWQQAGSAAVDGSGVVKWILVANAADERPDFEDGVKALAN